ncbi:urease accessory protein UreF [Parathalassolituus penaei]|uniref:Urease accessory protein UreF n=1 Tax=Parathalassolituus penaei TaxID=2997323 RepID=A0A9X3IQS9_9GAMM|nr:urease accessory UreF family protein [Parathalassolituus penaei]MCY0964492.1 urease accessory protein UreF [Parathalassolituus penaei]
MTDSLLCLSAATTSPLELLQLLQLSSASLPIGAFAWSQGLEAAIDQGQVSNAEELQAWLTTVCEQGLAWLELPIMARCYDAWQRHDVDSVNHWQQWLLASRETRELLDEETQIGGTFKRLLKQLGQLPDQLPEQSTYCGYYALAASQRGISIAAAQLGWCWGWLENQVLVACKTIPLGQTHAQQVLNTMLPVLVRSCEFSRQLADDDIGNTLPGLVMASARHEYQYSRLFRS